VKVAASTSAYSNAATTTPTVSYDRITHANGVVDNQTNDPNAMRRPRELCARLAGVDLGRSGLYQYDGAARRRFMPGAGHLKVAAGARPPHGRRQPQSQRP
jgi:hypothetical protein